ncbi:MAG: M13 family metallopeptidase [Chloroflexota bacterium]
MTPIGAVALEGSAPDIRPQDDLFGHVNGHWFETVEIPPDLPMAGGFITLMLEAESQVAEILRDAAAAIADGKVPHGSPLQQIGDLYTSFMDEAAVEALGAAPLAEAFSRIAAIQSTGDLAEVLGQLERHGVDGIFGAYVNTDDRHAERYIVNLTQDGLGLPDESYYREEAFGPVRDAYLAHVAAMLRLLGDDETTATDAAARIMALETRLAKDHWTRVESRDRVKSYNLMTLVDLRALVPGFDFTRWLRGQGKDESVLAEAIVRQPSYLSAVDAALAEVPLADWRAWLRFHLLSSYASCLSSAFVNENFNFYGRTLTGAPELKARWKRAVSFANSLLSEAVGEVYVARHFPPSSKVQMDELVSNLVEAYRRDIERLDWMGPETRARALEKLGRFQSKVGYPPKWRDYSSVAVRADDLLGNVMRLRGFETDRQFAKLGQPVDRDEWMMSPQTINAYYNPGMNEICFPAAILQPPFFDPEADPAYNYGGIGAVIGHEIGHGFDDQGSRYDGDGNLVDWWTEADRQNFQERADRLIAQYSEFAPRMLPDKRVNGGLTVGENIGDLGGLQIALQAYHISLDGQEPPVVDGLTGAQRVFTNWALCWRLKPRDEMAAQLLAVDPHAPAEFRANVVRNLDEYHAAYATVPGDGLWLDPADRVRIW